MLADELRIKEALKKQTCILMRNKTKDRGLSSLYAHIVNILIRTTSIFDLKSAHAPISKHRDLSLFYLLFITRFL